jgi:hypothetical protein
MKVMCGTAFEYSGVRSFLRDEIYALTVKEAETLAGIAGRKKDTALGALGYFTPADDEARAFFAARVNRQDPPAAPADKAENPAGKTKPPAAGSSGIF